MTRTRSAVTAAIILAGLTAAATTASAQGFPPPEIAMHKVRDNIYIIQSGASGNCTVILSGRGVILVDDKFESDHENIVNFVRSVTDQPIRYVINTHLHGDHTGGNALLQALDADVIASENARRIMAETRTSGLPNITMDDHLRVFLEDTPIDLYYFGRGHTDGDIVVHLPEQRILISGDLFATWEPYVHLIDYASGGSLRDWSRTLERVLQLDFDTVIPGHSAETDRATMEGYLANTIRLQDTIRAMNRAGRSREDIRSMLESEFGWGRLSLNSSLDGAIREMR